MKALLLIWVHAWLTRSQKALWEFLFTTRRPQIWGKCTLSHEYLPRRNSFWLCRKRKIISLTSATLINVASPESRLICTAQQGSSGKNPLTYSLLFRIYIAWTCLELLWFVKRYWSSLPPSLFFRGFQAKVIKHERCCTCMHLSNISLISEAV